MNIDHGPAVYDREKGHTNPDFDYPERFGDKVPKMVMVNRRVTSDFAFIGVASAAEKGQVFPAWTNRHGAVSAILKNGEKLGLYPHEFEVVEWLDASEVSNASA